MSIQPGNFSVLRAKKCDSRIFFENILDSELDKNELVMPFYMTN